MLSELCMLQGRQAGLVNAALCRNVIWGGISAAIQSSCGVLVVYRSDIRDINWNSSTSKF
jgi:hypothetical protein